MQTVQFALVTLWMGSSTKHHIVRVHDIESLTEVPRDQTSAPFPIVNAMVKGSAVQFVGKLDDFIPLLGAANYSNGVPEMTAQQIIDAKLNADKFEAEQKAERAAEIRAAVNAALYPNGIPEAVAAGVMPAGSGVSIAEAHALADRTFASPVDVRDAANPSAAGNAAVAAAREPVPAVTPTGWEMPPMAARADTNE